MRLRGNRILLVEDDVDQAQSACELLVHFGYLVQLASDGRAAVQRATRERFDLILMDCHMPILNGYDAARQIRQAEEVAAKASRVVIVALSADALGGERQRCIDAGMDDFVPKPYSVQTLQLALSRWLPFAVGMDASRSRTPRVGYAITKE